MEHSEKGLQKEKGSIPVEKCWKHKSFVSGSKQTEPILPTPWSNK